MAVVTPDVTVRPRDGGISVVSSATRRIAIAGLCVGGTTNQRLHTSDPDAVIDAFTGGQLVELACHGLRNSKRAVALDLVKITGSVSGYARTVAYARVSSSSGTITVSGTPNDSYEVVIEMTATCGDVSDGDGEMRISLDGGDSYGNVVAIPVNGIYAIPGTGLTITTGTSDDWDDGDVITFDCVGPGFTSGDLGTALTALDSDGYRYKTLFVLGTGETAAASAALASTILTHANAREAAKHFMWSICQAKHGLECGTVTEGGTPTPSEHITLTGAPIDPDYSFVVEITTTGGRGAGVFRWSSDGGTTWTASVTIHATDGINVLGTTGVTCTFANASYTDGNEYRWVPVSESDSDVDAAFAAIEGYRIGVCAGDVEIESSAVIGRKNRRGLIYCALLKQCEDELHHDMGRVRNGVLRGVTAIYRDEGVTPGLDEKKFITSTTYEGKPGKYYLTQGNTRAADGSVFDLSQFVDILNEACRITQVYLNDFPGEDLRTKSDGTIADEDAEAIDDQLETLLSGALVTPESIQAVEAKVNRTVSLMTTRKLSVRVTMVPKGYVKQAEADVGFAVTLTAA